MQEVINEARNEECKVYDELIVTFKKESRYMSTIEILLLLNKGDDPIDANNHMMSFLTAIGRQTSLAIGTSRTYTGASRSNSGKQRTIVCYNYKGEGQCPNSALNKRGNGMIQGLRIKFVGSSQAMWSNMHEEELGIFGRSRNYRRSSHTDFALMANLSHYGPDALAEVHNPDNMNNNLINQAVQAMPSSEQSNVTAVKNSNSFVQQDALVLSMIEQLKTQVVNCTKINLENKSVNDTLTAELERYKDQVKVLKQGQNVDLKSKDIISDSCA
ncbi:hypothetical protein Tco_1202347 [Tanacetum coccineum]